MLLDCNVVLKCILRIGYQDLGEFEAAGNPLTDVVEIALTVSTDVGKADVVDVQENTSAKKD